MKMRKFAAVAAGVFLGVASAAAADRKTGNATAETPAGPVWTKPVPLPFTVRAVKQDGEASFSVDHRACTFDKHLLTVGIGVSVPVKKAGGGDITDAQISALKTSYATGFGDKLNKVFALAVSTEKAERLRNVGAERAVMGHATLNILESPFLTKEQKEAVEEEGQVLAKGLTHDFEAFTAMLQSSLGDIGQQDTPNGVSLKLHVSALPSPQCK